MKILTHWIIYAISIAIAAYLLPGVSISSLTALLVLAVVLSIVNTLLRPVLILITLPLSILTLGLFTLFLNAFLILLAAQVVPGVSVASYWSAFFFGILIALVHMTLKRAEKAA